MDKKVFNRKVIEQIIVLMEEKHISCNKLADLSGVSQSVLDRFLKNEGPDTIDYSFLLRIVSCGLGLDMTEFENGSILRNCKVEDLPTAKRKSEFKKKKSDDK